MTILNHRAARCAALILAAAIATTPASAAQYILTITGTTGTDQAYTSDQTDRLGMFGTPGEVMNGRAFVARWTIDTTAPWQVIPPEGGPTTVIRSGINPFSQFGEGIVGSFTMAGVTIGNIGLGSNGTLNSGIGSQSQLVLVDTPLGDTMQINGTTSINFPGTVLTVNGRALSDGTIFMNNSFGTNIDFHSPGALLNSFAVTPSQLTGSNGVFSIGGNGLNSTYYLRTETVTLALSGSAVPEPESWAMLVIGFGFIGMASRRRRPSRLATQ